MAAATAAVAVERCALIDLSFDALVRAPRARDTTRPCASAATTAAAAASARALAVDRIRDNNCAAAASSMLTDAHGGREYASLAHTRQFVAKHEEVQSCKKRKKKTSLMSERRREETKPAKKNNGCNSFFLRFSTIARARIIRTVAFTIFAHALRAQIFAFSSPVEMPPLAASSRRPRRRGNADVNADFDRHSSAIVVRRVS